MDREARELVKIAKDLVSTSDAHKKIKEAKNELNSLKKIEEQYWRKIQGMRQNLSSIKNDLKYGTPNDTSQRSEAYKMAERLSSSFAGNYAYRAISNINDSSTNLKNYEKKLDELLKMDIGTSPFK